MLAAGLWPLTCSSRVSIVVRSDPEGRKAIRIWRFLRPFRILPCTHRKEAAMSWLDKLLGRGKKAAGDMTGDSSMKQEGMHQEQEGMAKERAESAEQLAQEERERAAEHHSQQE